MHLAPVGGRIMPVSSDRGLRWSLVVVLAVAVLGGARHRAASAVAPEAVPAPVPEDDTAALQPVDPAAAPATAASKPKAKTEPPSNTDGRCDRCGSCRGVRKVCMAKPVEREKTKVCWSSKEEVQCIPGRSIFCGKQCGKDECGCFALDIWKPTCARVITKTVPVKREVTRKVPGFEWTVEERCCDCRKPSAEEPACGVR